MADAYDGEVYGLFDTSLSLVETSPYDHSYDEHIITAYWSKYDHSQHRLFMLCHPSLPVKKTLLVEGNNSSSLLPYAGTEVLIK
jgi:hypothetical protein